MAMFKIIIEDTGKGNEVKVVANIGYSKDEVKNVPTQAILVGQGIMQILKDQEGGEIGKD